MRGGPVRGEVEDLATVRPLSRGHTSPFSEGLTNTLSPLGSTASQTWVSVLVLCIWHSFRASAVSKTSGHLPTCKSDE